MIQHCTFNPRRDVQQVEPDGALDLCKAFALGSVPSDLQAVESDFNGIEDPASIADKPDDVFAAMSMSKVIEERGKAHDN